MEEYLSTCSDSVRKALKYLRDNMRSLDKLSFPDAEEIITLKFDKELLERFLNSAKEEEFWKDIEHFEFEHFEILFSLISLGLENNLHLTEVIEDIKRIQTIEGRLGINDFEHPFLTRIFISLDPESKVTENAIKFLITRWKDIFSDLKYSWDLEGLAQGILALSELNYYQYKSNIFEMAEMLKSSQNEEGYFGEISKEEYSKDFLPIKSTAQCLQALVRVYSQEDSFIIKAKEWLLKQQHLDGSWGREDDTAAVILSLSELGDGPKISVEKLEWQNKLYLQKLKFSKPLFLKTCPPLNNLKGVKELYNQILEMIKNAKKEIRISSLYWDMLYEEIIDVCNNHPELKVRVIVRPKRDIQGLRDKICKNVLNILNISTKGNVRSNELLHTRMIIIDNKELLVSSTDLTRDQLIDEFNSGVYLRDELSISNAITFFDKIWENSEPIHD